MDMRSWYRWDSDGLTFYRAWNLEKTGLVTHGFTTRTGGASAAPLDSLNLGLHIGDSTEAVIENRNRCCKALDVDPVSFTTVEQVHSSRVAVIGPAERGAGATDLSGAIPGADAMITNQPGLTLGMFFADCVPVFFLDPVTKTIGLAHAGWKGTAAGVVAETLDAMAKTYGVQPGDCHIAIGPAIGRCCYEVGEDTATAIRSVCDDERPIVRGWEGKRRVDLPVANWLLLLKAGVPEENIALSSMCTACHEREFFSYRRDGLTGRMAALLSLRSAMR